MGLDWSKYQIKYLRSVLDESGADVAEEWEGTA